MKMWVASEIVAMVQNQRNSLQYSDFPSQWCGVGVHGCDGRTEHDLLLSSGLVALAVVRAQKAERSLGGVLQPHDHHSTSGS